MGWPVPGFLNTSLLLSLITSFFRKGASKPINIDFGILHWASKSNYEYQDCLVV